MFHIRVIREKDNKEVESIIRFCLREFGADHEGTAWMDPDLCRFSEVYKKENSRYFVAEDENGTLVGGAGIGPLFGVPHTCELQKMYCLPSVRGSGVSHMLMDAALDFAKGYYEKVYLETLENMKAAHRFYEKYGFQRIHAPLADTGHFACDVCYLLNLSDAPQGGEKGQKP